MSPPGSGFGTRRRGVVRSVAGWAAARALAACSAALAAGALVAIGDGGRALVPLAACAAASGLVAGVLWRLCTVPATPRTGAVHGAVCVAWLAMGATGAVAYLATGVIDSPGDAAFEAVAGFTTTSLSVLAPVEGTPDGVLVFRAATQWIGGFAALLVVVAILPLLGVGGVEGTEGGRISSHHRGAERRPLSVPRFASAARRLGSAYLLLSGIGVVLFLVAGLGPVDAASYAMTTISTGGFANHDGGLGWFRSALVEWCAVGGMALAGVNLAMALAVVRGDGRPLVRSVELRAYAAILLAATAVVALRTAPDGGPTLESLRHAAVSVTSVVSTTGHATADWTGWDDGVQLLLLVLIGVGAMSGSTGGGFRITRALTLLGSARRELIRALQPRSVVAVKVGRTSVDEGLVSHLAAYQITYLGIGAAGSIALAAAGLDLTAAVSGAISALATCGPALGDLGPFGSVADQPGAVRAVLMPLMLVGRLEIAPVLVGTVVLATGPRPQRRAPGPRAPGRTRPTARAAGMTDHRRPGPRSGRGTATDFAGRDRRVASTALHMTGISLLFVAAGMAACALVEAGYGDGDVGALMGPAVVWGLVGVVAWRGSRVPARVSTLGAFAAVTATWVALSVAGALPYVIADVLPRWDEALFESISGFTGTGSTVLDPIEGNGRGLLLWRQLTQWYGGLGIIVLVVAVLPLVGVGGFELLRAESPGATSDRLAPRVSDTAKRLWAVYAGLTVVVAVALGLAGMGAYDAVAHALATVATGGFSPRDGSILAFDSVAVELVLIPSMLAGAISFTLWWQVLRGRTAVPLRRSSELRFYLGLLAVATVVVTLVLVGDGGDVAGSLRQAAFNVASIGSTTGFGTVDIVAWGAAAQLVLLVLMVCGGMAGSTSGATKQFRIQTLLAHARREVRRVSSPRAVLPVKLGGHAVPEAIVTRIVGFVTLYFLLVVAGIVALAMLGADLATAIGSTVTAISTGGPGLGETGPASTFLALDRPSRAILMGYMLLGRLELFPLLLVLLAPLRALRYGARRQAAATRR